MISICREIVKELLPVYERIVDQNIDIPPLFRQVPHETADLLRLANIQLHGQHLDTLTDLLYDIRRNLLQRIDPPRSEDETQAAGRRAGEFESGASTDAGRCACDHNGLAFEALRHRGRGHGAEWGEGEGRSCRRR